MGSPVLAAAGLDADVPHTVQHGFSMRMKAIVDAEVDDYTERNLPNLAREVHASEARKGRRYRPGDGLDPEHRGLDLDPDPIPGQPFLFTLGELERDDPHQPSAPEPFTEAQKQALRAEIALADDYAKRVGNELCAALLEHRLQIRGAVQRIVDPQIDELMAELARELDSPNWSESG